MNSLDKLAVENFRKYLRIPSVHPDVNYEQCVKFLEKQAESLELPINVYYTAPNKPVVILTWVGQEPNLPTILLNSHMDVVPVFEEEWNHDPFGAEMDEQGNIYARGAQDMKCVGIQYLEAIRRLKKQGVVLKRTVHVSFVPDEETGGQGMQLFVKMEEFQNLNIGFSLDEGMANPEDAFLLFNGERPPWQFLIHCPGQSGHGSLLLKNTAGEKVRRILEKFYDFRDQEIKKLEDNPSLNLGDVTTVNATELEGGVQSNVIPPEMGVVIDCRIAPTVDLEDWEKTIDQWCKESGEDVWVEYRSKNPQAPVTKLDETNPYWIALKRAADQMDIKIVPQIFPAATDSRFIRQIGIPAIGFSPMSNTPVLLHDHNEYLNVNVFLKGIEIYCQFITALGNAEITMK